MRTRTMAFAAALGVFVIGGLARGGEYLTNGSFQTGDLTGWSYAGQIEYDVKNEHTGYDEQSNPHWIYPTNGPCYFGMVEGDGGYGAVYQTVAVEAGQDITVDFSWRTVWGSGVGGWVTINNSSSSPSVGGNFFKGLESSCEYSANSSSFMSEWADIPSQSFESDGYITVSFFSETVGGETSVVCMDGASIYPTPMPEQPQITTLELLTDQAAPHAWGVTGNAWGGTQSRIGCSDNGIFTSYLLDPNRAGHEAWEDDDNKKWQLLWRKGDNWYEADSGRTGRDPVHTLVRENGSETDVYVVADPNDVQTVYYGQTDDGDLTLSTKAIPGMQVDDYPYGGAGIDPDTGNIAVSRVYDTEQTRGHVEIAYYDASGGAISNSNNWDCHDFYLGDNDSDVKGRHCYPYLFPDDDGLTFVAPRDVNWSDIGLQQPNDVSFGQAMNAWGMWREDDFNDVPDGSKWDPKAYFAVNPDYDGQVVNCNSQQDVYIDTDGNIHVLYWKSKEATVTTWGRGGPRHAVLSSGGTVLADVALPEGDVLNDVWYRIFQDNNDQFWLLRRDGKLYPAGRDGLTLGTPVELNLGGFDLNYTGFTIAVPRGGTEIEDNIVHLAFSAGDDCEDYVYAELQLPEHVQGDADGDGDVDGSDLSTLQSNWTGSSGSGKDWNDGDFDWDGDVDLADLMVLRANWDNPEELTTEVQYNTSTGQIIVTCGDISFLRIYGADPEADILDGSASPNWSSLLTGSSTHYITDDDYQTGFDASGDLQDWGPTSLGNIASTGLGDGDILFTYTRYDSTYGQWLTFDGVATVVNPEPATLVLLVLGSVGMLRRRRA